MACRLAMDVRPAIPSAAVISVHLTHAARALYDRARVSALSLPYTILILLVELAVGSLAVVTLFDGRAMVTRGYVQMGALVVVPCALLALLVTRQLAPASEVDGYLLDASWLGPLRLLAGALVAVSLAHLGASFVGEGRAAAVWIGGLGVVVGVGVLAMVAALIAPSAWSYAGVLVSVLGGALTLGGALMAMSWGHWYLTNSGLPKEPLEQMSLLVAAALLLQAVLLVAGVIVTPREVPAGAAALGVALGANPAFWLRVGVGLIFPFVLALLAYRAAAIRGMMTATGLLYIATGAVLAGEAMARGLLFMTGMAV